MEFWSKLTLGQEWFGGETSNGLSLADQNNI